MGSSSEGGLIARVKPLWWYVVDIVYCVGSIDELEWFDLLTVIIHARDMEDPPAALTNRSTEYIKLKAVSYWAHTENPS